MNGRWYWKLCVATAVWGLASGCGVISLPLWGPVQPQAADAFAVAEVRDLDYYQGAEGRTARHRLDLFLPTGKARFPVVVLVHGGAWLMGDNRCCGLYSTVGKYLASRGIGVAMPNYRLSPGVQHPKHVQDVARAVAWTRAHIAEYGGCPDQLFLAGHSAGGHLVALLATDEQYLRAEELDATALQGVIAVSGVYRLPPGNLDITLGGGDSAAAFHLNGVIPIRGRTNPWPTPQTRFGIPLSINVFGPAFGDDPRVREAASPLRHVRAGLPPFLIIAAEHDLPTLTAMAEEFHQALLDHGCAARYLRVAERNHNTILFRAIEDQDTVARAMLDFIRPGTR